MHIPKTEIISDEERAEQDIPDTASLIPSLSDNTVSGNEAVSENEIPVEDQQESTGNEESVDEPLISGPGTVAVAGEENGDNETETENNGTENTENTENTETE